MKKMTPYRFAVQVSYNCRLPLQISIYKSSWCEQFTFPRSVGGIGQFPQNRKYSQIKMVESKWNAEKTRILSLPLEEKRKLYRAQNYITLDQVETWSQYASQHKSTLEDRKHTDDDLTEFRNLSIDTDKNEKLAEKVSLFQSDITKLEIDAIVNAANAALKSGGGVDGAIHRAAGPLLQAECNSLGGCPTGEARVTGGYDLPAKYVIHTVGPQNGSAPNLQSCYEKSLAHARELGLKSIAFPCISTGIYGFPNRLAAHIALRTARKFLEENDDMHRIIFSTYLSVDVEIYESLMQLYFPVK